MTNAASSSGDPKMVTGLFRDGESLERAYEVVHLRGFGTADINVVMSDDTRRRYFSDDRQVNVELGRKIEEGGEMGGPMGGNNWHRHPGPHRGGCGCASRLGIGSGGPDSCGTGGRWRHWPSGWPYWSA